MYHKLLTKCIKQSQKCGSLKTVRLGNISVLKQLHCASQCARYWEYRDIRSKSLRERNTVLAVHSWLGCM